MPPPQSPVRPRVLPTPRGGILRIGCCVACLVFGRGLRTSPPLGPTGRRPVHFSTDILPILSENCFTCHGPDAKARKADLRLDLKEIALRKIEPVIVPGKSNESELIQRGGQARMATKVMPPSKSGKKLTPHQIELLTKWIDQGAQWSKHWAFEPVHRNQPPAVRDVTWIKNPIDRFVLARLETEGLAPTTAAGRTTLIRRLTLDLLGLPPTPDEVDAFLADTGPGAYGALVDQVYLASPVHGERMAMDWLDGARYADTNGFQNDFARIMWPWRDWVIAAFNRNLPFDRFVVEQIAGDLLPEASRDQKIATGFNRNNRTVTEAGSIDEEYRVENTVDRVETTATLFLGLTMGCCRCHDHKFDPVSQAEFYSFYGFFNNVNEQGVYTETRGNVPPLIKLPTAENLKHQGDLEIAIAAAKVSGDKAWIEKTKKAIADYDTTITTVMVMEDRATVRDTFVLKRGRYDMPDSGKKVAPGVPTCLPPLPSGATRNRLGLAQWLASPENPLTARVAVNRIWQHPLRIGPGQNG